ncbi:hypothetical protein BDV12DRAFT_19693 [Aspergillus spectabilis]
MNLLPSQLWISVKLKQDCYYMQYHVIFWHRPSRRVKLGIFGSICLHPSLNYVARVILAQNLVSVPIVRQPLNLPHGYPSTASTTASFSARPPTPQSNRRLLSKRVEFLASGKPARAVSRLKSLTGRPTPLAVLLLISGGCIRTFSSLLRDMNPCGLEILGPGARDQGQ